MISRRGSSSSGVGGHTSLEEGCVLIARRGSYFRWTRGSYILISRGLLPPLEEGHIRSNGVELAVADRCRLCVL